MRRSNGIRLADGMPGAGFFFLISYVFREKLQDIRNIRFRLRHIGCALILCRKMIAGMAKSNGRLTAYPAEIGKQAQERFEKLIEGHGKLPVHIWFHSKQEVHSSD